MAIFVRQQRTKSHFLQIWISHWFFIHGLEFWYEIITFSITGPHSALSLISRVQDLTTPCPLHARKNNTLCQKGLRTCRSVWFNVKQVKWKTSQKRDKVIPITKYDHSQKDKWHLRRSIPRRKRGWQWIPWLLQSCYNLLPWKMPLCICVEVSIWVKQWVASWTTSKLFHAPIISKHEAEYWKGNIGATPGKNLVRIKHFFFIILPLISGIYF